MLETVRQWLKPPIFEHDEARTNAAQVLYIILWIVLLTSLVSLGYFSTLNANRVRNVLIISAMFVITLVSMWCLRIGHVYSVGRIYLVVLWVVSLGVSIVTRGILSPYPVFQIILILLASVVFRPVYAVYFAIGAATSDTVLLFISTDLPYSAPLYAEQSYRVLAVSNWLVYVSSYLMTAALVMYTARIIRQNIKHIREREEELAKRNRELAAENVQRQQIEAELRESEEKFRMLTEMALAGIYILQGTPNPTFVYVNPTLAKIMGYELDEIINKLTLADFLSPDQLELATQRIQQRIDGLTISPSYTYMAKRKDGSQFPLEVSSTAIEYQGKPAVVGTVIDLSAVRQAEQARADLQGERKRIEFLRDFVDSMTHDLKTPLTVIKTSTYLVGQSKDEVTRHGHLQRINGQVNQMMTMVEDMLTIARLDSVPELNLTETHLNRIIEEACEQLSTKANRKRLTIACELAPDLQSILADTDQIYHATTNLIENAINYTPDDGTIIVRTRRTPDDILIEVEDTGIGIGEDDLPHIFERFFRAKNAKILPGGSGLGLAIVDRIVKLHQGQIEVTSTVGKGTTIRVKLPLSNDPS